MRPPRLLLFVLLCGAAFGAWFLPSPARGFQHVRNGSFEDGMSGWSVASGGSPTITSSGPGIAEGSRALRAEPGTLVRISQPLDAALAAGAYTVSLSGSTSGGEATVDISVEPQSGAGAPVRFTTRVGEATSDISHGFTFAAAGNVRLGITLTAPDAGALTIDDVRIDGAAPVTLTPTPTATLIATQTPGPGASPTSVVSPTPTASVIVAAIASTLRNAGFEERRTDGAPAVWEQYGGTLVASSNARTGATAARIESMTDSTKWMHQAVTVSGGGAYEFSAWALDDDPAVARAFLRISWYASDDASGSNIGGADSTDILDAPAAGYRHLTTGPVTAPADARSARVRVLLAPASAAPAAILVDDATFGPATPLPPTPASEATVASVGITAPDRVATARGSGERARTGTGFVAGDASAPPAGARIVINEVLYDADSGDTPDAQGEWVELHNAGTTSADLAGWMLADAAAADSLPSYMLAPGAFVVVAASDSILQIRPDLGGRVIVLDGRLGNGLGNDGDTLLLVAPDGTWIDAISWGSDSTALNPAIADMPEGHSIERSPAGADTGRAADFIDNSNPSPGGPIESAPARVHAPSRPRVEILAGDSEAAAWLPWAIAAASLTALAGVASWRAFDVVRQRVRP